MSQNPAIAIDKLRPHTQRLWRSLSSPTNGTCPRRYATRWNSIRHRIAISIHQRPLRSGLRPVEGEMNSTRDDGLDVNLRDIRAAKDASSVPI